MNTMSIQVAHAMGVHAGARMSQFETHRCQTVFKQGCMGLRTFPTHPARVVAVNRIPGHGVDEVAVRTHRGGERSEEQVLHHDGGKVSSSCTQLHGPR
jgi:hypothetical protein